MLRRTGSFSDFRGKADFFMKQERLWTQEFLGMSCSNFFQFMSQYIMIAALPLFIMDQLGGGEIEAGLAMTSFQIGTVVCRPFAGRWIDRIHKGRLMLGTTVAFLMVMAGFNFAASLQSVYLLRLLQGIVFAMGTTAAATLAALLLPPSRKGEGIGYFAVSTNLAMVLGPLLGLVVMERFGAQAMFIFLTGLALLTIWVSNRKQLCSEIVLPSGNVRKGWRLQDFVECRSLPMAMLGGLVFFAYGGILTFIPLYAKSLGMSTETSLFFVVFAAVIVVTRPLIGRVFDRMGPDFTVYPGFLFFGAGLLIFSRIQTTTGLLAAAAVLGAGFGALSPAFQTLAIQSAAPERAGVATATYFWSLDISVGLAAVVLSLVAERFGYSFMYGVVSLCVLAAAAGAYFFWSQKKRKQI